MNARIKINLKKLISLWISHFSNVLDNPCIHTKYNIVFKKYIILVEINIQQTLCFINEYSQKYWCKVMEFIETGFFKMDYKIHISENKRPLGFLTLHLLYQQVACLLEQWNSTGSFIFLQHREKSKTSYSMIYMKEARFLIDAITKFVAKFF